VLTAPAHPDGSTPVYDLVRNTVYRATRKQPLVIPRGRDRGGSRAITSFTRQGMGISVYTPVIVKYRDARTDSRIQLEDLLR